MPGKPPGESTHTQPRDRITFVNGKLLVRGVAIDAHPDLREFTRALGEPTRHKNDEFSYLFDQQGILLLAEPNSERIRVALIFFNARPNRPQEPKNSFSGLVEIDGYAIQRDDPMDAINAAIRSCKFNSGIADTAKAECGPYKLRIAYEPVTSEGKSDKTAKPRPLITTISIDFSQQP